MNPYHQFLEGLRLIRQCSYSGLNVTELMSMHEICITHSFQANTFGMLGKKNGLLDHVDFAWVALYVHHAAGELYFLIILCNHVKGVKSFEDL
jgi:hypothetical protein